MPRFCGGPIPPRSGNLDLWPLPSRRIVVQVTYPELPPAQRKWWLILEPDGTVDLCQVEPGFDVDLFVSADLRAMTEIWLGLKTVARARADEDLVMVGSRGLDDSMQSWLGLSPFAGIEKRAS